MTPTVFAADIDSTPLTEFRRGLRCWESQRVLSRSHAPTEECSSTLVTSRPSPIVISTTVAKPAPATRQRSGTGCAPTRPATSSQR